MSTLNKEIKKYKDQLDKDAVNYHQFTDDVIRKDIVDRVRIGFYPATRKMSREILKEAKELGI